MTDTIPRLALSVRQPWAWAIIHGGKDIENRDWQPHNTGLKFRGRVAIHASSGMTRDEYEDARDDIDVILCPETGPPAHELVRGAIIGSVEVVDIVNATQAAHVRSPWFSGPVGLVLRNPIPCTPIPCKGALGFFEWHGSGAIAAPVKWMLPKPAKVLA